MSFTTSHTASDKIRGAVGTANLQGLNEPSEGIQKPVIQAAIDNDPDGLVPSSAASQALKLTIPGWANQAPDPEFNDVLEIYLRMVGETSWDQVYREVVPTPPDGVVFPIERDIPLEHVRSREGKFEVKLTVRDWNQQLPTDSAIAKLQLDRTAPWAGSPTGVPALIIDQDVITDESLETDGGVLCEIPDFVDEKKESVFVGVSVFDHIPGTVPETPHHGMLVPANREVTVPKAVFDQFKSNLLYFVYVLVDKAGNRSEMSLPKAVPLARGDLATNFQLPDVNLASDGDQFLIDRVDANDGVKVLIQMFDNSQPEDLLQIHWGSEPLLPVPVGAWEGFPLEVPVSWATLKAAYDFDGPDMQDTDVSYQVLRGTYAMGGGTRPIVVDLAVHGPVDPGDPDPDPISEQLKLPILTSFTGETDELVPADQNEPATVTIELIDEIVADSHIGLYWNDNLFAFQSVNNAVAGILTFTVPWKVIAEHGNHPELPLYYDLMPPNANNRLRSRTKQINVDVKPIILDPVSYPDIHIDPNNGARRLNCNSVREYNGEKGVWVRVPLSEHVKINTVLVMCWDLFRRDGTTPVVGADAQEAIRVPDNATTHVDWFLEYEKHIKPAYIDGDEQYGRGEAWYVVQVNGVDHPSDKKREMVAPGQGGGGTCVFPPV